MKIINNISLKGVNDRNFLLDIYYNPSEMQKKIVLMAHGFKGFKDWGIWDLCAKEFAKANFVFIKFNFSHNGTKAIKPTEFTDLEAFGQNNFSKELADIHELLQWIGHQTLIPASELDLNNIHFIGHSRGGGIGVLATHFNPEIKSLITWASVDSLAYMWLSNPDFVEEWRAKGVHYILNGRTKQQMPLYFQLYEDWNKNEGRFDLQKVLQGLNKPVLIIHGDADPAVPVQAAYNLHEWTKNSQLLIIKGADHVFNGSHPYTREVLPENALALVQASLNFLKYAI